MDWSLRGCARHGHETYEPTEPELRSQLVTQSPAGEAWRCLRCAAFVVGPPKASGPASQAPRVLRGKALREATVLRVFAVERWFRATLLIALGIGVLSFRSSQTSLRDVFDRALPAARPLADVFNIDLAHSKTVDHIRSVLGANSHTLTWVALALFGYGLIQVAEGIGLWSLRRWGEYLAVVATGIFLPLEIYELSEKITWLRVVAFVVNLGLVAYLILSKRLFGVRGGAAAYHAERANDSLLEVEATAAGAGARPGSEHEARQPERTG